MKSCPLLLEKGVVKGGLLAAPQDKDSITKPLMSTPSSIRCAEHLGNIYILINAEAN
jgi:hypothetical protein